MSVETWKRILIGTAPFGFALEVLLRTVVVYLFLVPAVRVLGKRMNGQVTNVELGVMLALGAIVSVPMQSPDRGIVPGLVLLVSIVALQRGLSELGTRSTRAEQMLIGRPSLLVRDGVVVPEQLRRAHISQQQLFSMLRSKHVRHLGEVERVYLEGCGAFSVLRRAQPSAGLSVLPLPSPGMTLHREPRASFVCAYCGLGAPARADSGAECENCKHRSWVEAASPQPAGGGA